MLVEVVTYYLELTDRNQFRPAARTHPETTFSRVEPPSIELSRRFYGQVGGDWHWIDRLAWTDERWGEYLSRPALQTWLLSVAATPVGYVEMERQPEATIEIVQLGLLPEHIGQGLGGRLLTEATEAAWRQGASRVWLHTCSLDHPHALAHYQARGFRLFRTETKSKELPEAGKPPT